MLYVITNYKKSKLIIFLKIFCIWNNYKFDLKKKTRTNIENIKILY